MVALKSSTAAAQIESSCSSAYFSDIDGGSVRVNDVKQGGMFNGQTLLHCAAGRGHMELVQALLQRGAQAGIQNAKGKTAAQEAAEKGHAKVSSE